MTFAGLCPNALKKLPPTPLEQFAITLAQGVRPLDEACEVAFQMYTLPVKAFTMLSSLKSHEELLATGELVKFEKSMGSAIFVSHQWVSDRHPDPAGRQFRILQDALANILSGRSKITVPPVVEIFDGLVPVPTAAQLGAKSLFIWYDYFSCPQANMANRRSAINSIHAYVVRCDYFMVLSPALKHESTGTLLSRSTWASRGWCRAERMSHELGHAVNCAIVVESATHQILLPQFSSFLYSAGEGCFTLEEDRDMVGSIVVQMVWNKLLYLLSQGDLHSYRFLLNQQSVRFASLNTPPIDFTIPGFSTDVDPLSDPGTFLVDRFLHQNGFRSISHRDKAGWSPLCFAAMDGSPLLVQTMLQQRADPNDRTTKSKPQALMEKHTPVLSIAACYKSNRALALLLAARAEPNGRDGRKATALHWACVSDNAEGIRLLCEGGGDLNAQAFPEIVPLMAACCEGTVAALKEILRQAPNHTLQYCLHFALIMNGGSTNMVSSLVQARADINEQFEIRVTKQPSWWVLFKVALVRQSTRASRLSMVAHHHHLATPLMLSILCGSFGAAYFLLAAGARTDLRNGRGKTAADLAKEVFAPEPLMMALEQGMVHELDEVDGEVFSTRL